jgi:hypothetical protein
MKMLRNILKALGLLYDAYDPVAAKLKSIEEVCEALLENMPS